MEERLSCLYRLATEVSALMIAGFRGHFDTFLKSCDTFATPTGSKRRKIKA